MYLLVSLVFTYKVFSTSFYAHNFSKSEFNPIPCSNFQENLSSNFFCLEKKIVNDFLYKKKLSNVFFSSVHNDGPEIIYLDKESKILGNKKKFERTQQKLSLSFIDNKKFLKSTLFGVIKLVTV